MSSFPFHWETVPGVPVEVIAKVDSIVYISQCIILVSLGVAAWDAIVCFRMEYERIWKRSWSFVTVVYLISRYFLFVSLGVSAWLWVGTFTPERCLTLYKWIPGLVAVTELAGEVLLFLRAWALWQRHPAVLAAGGFLILSYAAILLYCTLDAFVPVPAFRQKAACIATGGPHNNIGNLYWIWPVVFDVWVTAMLAYKAIPIIRRNKVSQELVGSILREGVVAAVVITVLNIGNTALFTSNVANNAVLCPISIALTSIMSSRLVLSLRDPKHLTNSNGATGPTRSFWTRDMDDENSKTNYGSRFVTSRAAAESTPNISIAVRQDTVTFSNPQDNSYELEKQEKAHRAFGGAEA